MAKAHQTDQQKCGSCGRTVHFGIDAGKRCPDYSILDHFAPERQPDFSIRSDGFPLKGLEFGIKGREKHTEARPMKILVITNHKGPKM